MPKSVILQSLISILMQILVMKLFIITMLIVKLKGHIMQKQGFVEKANRCGTSVMIQKVFPDKQ